MGMLKEFREFAVKGNMVDLAIGVVIGGAFGAIINSLVTDVLMPVLGMLTGGADFSDKFVVLSGSGTYASLAEAKAAGAATLNYGLFINALISFIIVAFALFMVVKAINRMRREPEPADAAPPAPTEEVKLLTEIRDALHSKPL